jgi:hypothetical protein
MSRFLYEKSVCYQGHLIVPFVFGMIANQPLYSYKLLSELGRKGKFHQAENPANIYSSSTDEIIKVAKAHLDENSDVVQSLDLFKFRYTYRGNLIIIANLAGKYFYDHYPADTLKNIAAPRLFQTEQDCINWVKEGLDRSHTNQSV